MTVLLVPLLLLLKCGCMLLIGHTGSYPINQLDVRLDQFSMHWWVQCTVFRFDMSEPAVKRAKVDDTAVMATLDVDAEGTVCLRCVCACVCVCVCVWVCACVCVFVCLCFVFIFLLSVCVPVCQPVWAFLHPSIYAGTWDDVCKRGWCQWNTRCSTLL